MDLTFIRDRMQKQFSARHLRDRQDEISRELAKLTAPVLTGAIDLAKKAEGPAEVSDQRYETFEKAYPFYPFERRAPAFVMLHALARFLGSFANDREPYQLAGITGLADYGDGFPSKVKRLIGLGMRVRLVGDQLPATFDEFIEAHEAFREMQVKFTGDLQPMFKPIEAYFKTVNKVLEKERPRRLELQREGVQGFYPGWAVHGEGLGELLARIVLGAPGGREALQSDGRALSVWARAGKPPAERPFYTDQRKVRVLVGLRQRWIPVEQLKDFIAGK